jgi:hypothetical protein
MKRDYQMMTFLLSILILSACKSIIPVINHPETYFTFVLYSVPSGATVYQLNADGTPGRAIGTTPFTWREGISVPHFPNKPVAISTPVSSNDELIRFWTNAPGIRLSNVRKTNDTQDKASFWYDFLLSCALASDDYNTTLILDKITASVGLKNDMTMQYPPQDEAMVVHLQPRITGGF